MDCTVTITRVEFLEINPLFESELKLYFSIDGCECYALMPGSKKELCKLFNLNYNDSDECRFEDIEGKQCKVDKKDGSCTFVECLEEND